MRKKWNIFALTILLPLQMLGWGKMGHAVVAQVAENHLTPKARTAMEQYLGGKSMADVASYADTYRCFWVMDLGFKPSNPDYPRVKWLTKFDFSTPTNIIPMSHSITVYGDKFKSAKTENNHGRYVHNCAYNLTRFAKELQHAESMDPEDRFRKLCWIIHLIGDMHCPQHIIYVPRDTVKGAFLVHYKGKEVNYHGFWDKTVVEDNAPSKNIQKYAQHIDNANAAQIRKLCKGNIFKWIQQESKLAWQAHKYQSGDTLPDDYAKGSKSLTHNQLRDAGYRLATFLNRIFE